MQLKLSKYFLFKTLKEKIIVINFTKKMNIDALIEKIQHKFIINFY